MSLLLGYTVLFDPLDAHGVWWLTVLPLAIGISMAYKGARVKTFEAYWRNVVMMTVQVVVALVGLAALSYVVLELIVPRVS
jgi:hypothetical protein